MLGMLELVTFFAIVLSMRLVEIFDEFADVFFDATSETLP